MNDKLHNNIPITINNIYNFYTASSSSLVKTTPEAVTKDEALQYFQNNQTLYCSTITLGNIRDMKLSYYDQCVLIKKYINIYKNSIPAKEKYFFTLEANKNGVAHAHGICTAYPIHFRNTFKPLGSHNTRDESYKLINDLASYKKYIMKEQDGISDAITNISKTEALNIKN